MARKATEYLWLVLPWLIIGVMSVNAWVQSRKQQIELNRRRVWMSEVQAYFDQSRRWTFDDQVEFAERNGLEMTRDEPRAMMTKPVLPEDQ